MFDVNETLSDMSSLAARFDDVGAPESLAQAWFTAVLRDGFALTVNGSNPDFGDVAATCLAGMLDTVGVRDVWGAVDGIMTGFMALPVHEDVVDGVTSLAGAGLRLVTLSNGSATVARGLFDRNGITAHFEQIMSVQDARAWKPATSAYQYALAVCGVDAQHAMLVAAHPWDIHGAAMSGLRTAYINRRGTPYPGYFTPPDLEVASLTALAEALQGAG